MLPFGGSSTTTSSIAAFADATYALIEEKLFLTLGGRFSHDEVTDAFFNTTQFTPFTGYTGRHGENIAFTGPAQTQIDVRSEEHTSELQSLMRISYAVFCLKKTNKNI